MGASVKGVRKWIGSGVRSGAGGEDGIALFLTLAVLSILSVLAVAGFFLARLELASGRNLREGVRALVRAESGVSDAIRGWNSALYDSLPAGIDTLLAEPPAPGWANRRVLTRLRNNLFLLRSEAIRLHTTGDTLARREVAAFLRAIAPAPGVRAALSVSDSVITGAGTRISGADIIPSGWTGCGPPDTARAGILMVDTAALIRGCPGPGCMSGAPPLMEDSLFSPLAADDLGGISYGQLAGHSGLVVSGTPFSMPAPSGHAIIHSRGDLVLTGGTGRGMLLVDGNLTLGGGAWFAGFVRVRGTLQSGPGGGTILGAVRAGSADLRPGPGVLKIAYSACVLRRVSAGARSPFPLSGYWWWEVP